MRSEERAELRGQTLDGRYRLDATIGVGGTGVVFEATQLATQERVIIKTLRPTYAYNSDLIRRLEREVEVARQIFHPGIVSALDEGILHDGSPYVVMRYVHAESLASYLRRAGALRVCDAALIGTRVASILQSVHHRGYVHRDIKPEHVLLNRGACGELEVYLIDFGVCTSHTIDPKERELERGRVFGTPSYASPEQACGNPNVAPSTDLYGLGVTLFEVVTGDLPHRASNVTDLLRNIIRNDAPRVRSLVPHVDLEFDALIASLLARDPHQRPQSARAVSRKFKKWIDDRIMLERDLAARLLSGRDAPSLHPTATADEIVAA